MSLSEEARIGGLRLIRRAVLILFVAVFVLSALLGYAFVEIQSSRADSIRSTCLESNRRHDRTVQTLDTLLEKRRESASRQELRRLERSRASTLLLIDALAPKRDCELRTKRLVGGVIDASD